MMRMCMRITNYYSISFSELDRISHIQYLCTNRSRPSFSTFSHVTPLSLAYDVNVPHHWDIELDYMTVEVSAILGVKINPINLDH